ncbi:PREDICTED: putative uncharacterized protein DDB_G0290521, partial [Leptosomus discolor]|uniref:putative uncharacterized protein DDB_G0290521 n=1 Tax=Leptosomus discolor TaxID=188344 RepID=UPI00052256B9
PVPVHFPAHYQHPSHPIPSKLPSPVPTPARSPAWSWRVSQPSAGTLPTPNQARFPAQSQ